MMKKRLPFWLTALIFILSVLLYFAVLAWITDTFDTPDWVWAVGNMIFFLVVFELPSRIGPKPFDTFLSSVFKLHLRDKLILLVSVILVIGLVSVSDPYKDQFNWLEKLGSLILFLLFALGPIWFFGSQEAKDELFKKKNNNTAES